MASFNKVMLIGNLTRDPEVRWTPKGSAVTDLGIAVNRAYTLDSGEKREETTFVDVTMWGRLAEIAGQYLSKGRPVFIEGRLQLDTWDDKTTGQKRSKLKVIGENMQLLGSPRDGGGAPASGPPQSGGSAAQGATGAASAIPAPASGSEPAPYQPPASSPTPSPTSAPAPSETDAGPDFSEQDGDDEIPF